MKELLANARALIREELQKARRPVVAWSGGKESQLMLALVREVAPRTPLLHFSGFASSLKHAFSLRMIDEWDLTVLPMLPAGRDVVAKGDHVEVIEAYLIGKDVWIYFPIEAEPGHVPGPASHCAVQKLNEPTEEKPYSLDMVLIGHRDDDVDPVHGPVPLSDSVAQGNGVRFVYPLKDFTEGDVWEASALLGVPQNEARYKRGEMSANPDYFALCTRCLEPREGETVICPKTDEPVFNLGKLINPEERREHWRQLLINIERSNHGHE